MYFGWLFFFSFHRVLPDLEEALIEILPYSSLSVAQS